ncbi:MAG: peptidylprolyl isomerase, partial [Acidimicrobiales bacterium]
MPSEKRARQRAGKLQRRTARARKAKARKLLRNSAIVVVVAAVVIAVVITTRGHSPSSPPAKGTAGKGSASTVTTLTTAPAGSPAAEQAAANRAATAAGCPAGTTARVNTLHWSSPPAMAIDPQKAYSATFKTTAGTFAVSLLAKTAPKTVNSFVFLAKTGYFHCVTFHRVVT